MRHQPRLYLPSEWASGVIEADDRVRHHLTRVLRYREGAAVTYTDGAGTVGSGVWTGNVIERGPERSVTRPEPVITVAVAPPKSKDRQRFVVEKLQELGVDHVVWLATERTQTTPPRNERSFAWTVAALEQSRGAWLMDVAETSIDDLDDAAVADPDGSLRPEDLRTRASITVAIGPEGGFTDAEISRFHDRVALGATVLRTETAAIAISACIRL